MDAVRKPTGKYSRRPLTNVPLPKFDMRSVYLLDTSALLTLRDDEPGAQQVADIFDLAIKKKHRCIGCFNTLMEVFYRVWKDEGRQAGRLAYEQCLALPVEWKFQTSGLLEKAAELKAVYPISLADAWIAACAELEDAKLVHKDPEFKALPLPQIHLPFKPLKRT